MLVTMFTDASLINETKSGGWAMWAKSERGCIQFSGPLKGQCMTSGEAELKAIANGIDILVRSDICIDGDSVLVTADNLQALSALGHSADWGTFCKPMKRARDIIRQLVEKHQLVIRTRHVKAHSGTGEPRLWVHSQCDRRARQAARQLHAERSGG